MSQDIRSYFTKLSRNSKSNATNKTGKPKAISDSEEERDDNQSAIAKPSKPSVKKKRKILSSDSEEEPQKKTTKGTKSTEQHLKPVSIDDIFGDKAIKQSKVEHRPNESKKKKIKTEQEVHKDPDFEKTLLELDEDVLIENVEVLDRTIEKAMYVKDTTESNRSEKDNGHHRKEDIKTELGVHDDPDFEKTLLELDEDAPDKTVHLEKEKHHTTNTPKKRSREHSKGSATKKQKMVHSDSGIDPDQEAFERKRYSAMLYQKYLHRGGPKHCGEKEYPQGKPDCLNNLTFLRTGVLDSLEGEDFEDLVKKHGGRVVHAVSRKVNYIVVGDDPGPAKLSKAKDYGIPEIDEDGLLDMILTRSDMKPRYSKHKSDASLESGFDTEDEEERKRSKETVKESPGMVRKEEHLSRKDEFNLKKKYEEKSVNGTQETSKLPESEMSWTEKYKPKDIKSIIGQQDAKSNMNRLRDWLKNWSVNRTKDVKRPSLWAKNDDGAYFKAALLSGPPGVGKTTTARLVCESLGFDIVELNASDTRSKRMLHEEVSQLLKNTSIASYAAGQKNANKKRVLLMDEVDGMAGNEDRGGVQELINLIKTTNIPIVCMCNDRNHQKLRTFVSYCFELRFSKPKPEQIRGAMMSICFKEGIKIHPNALMEVINGTGCDVRQTLNHLAMWSAVGKTVSLESAQKESQTAKKDIVLGPWEVVRKVFTATEHQDMSLADRARLFFYDYSIGPLFVQENYLNVTPEAASELDKSKRIARAADAISMGDLLGSKIRGSNNWALLESQAIFASVLPGHYMSGRITGKINFPSWLGKNSSAGKRKRMLNELHLHARISMSGNRLAMNLDYLGPLRNAIVTPLRKYGLDGIAQAINVMKGYCLLREDLDNLMELAVWKGGKNPFNEIESKIKSAFTRTYNKEAPLLPFAATASISKKRSAAVDAADELNEENQTDDEEDIDDDDPTHDALIKVKSKETKPKKQQSGKAGGSKEKDSSRTKKNTKKK